MLHSAEIRWFVPGPLPDEVLNWFSRGEDLAGLRETKAGAQVREDQYLLFPHCETVGLKLREGKLEVKALTQPPKPINVNDRICGLSDQWVKWSFGSEGLKQLEKELYQSSRWIKVKKDRYLRKYSADSDSPIEVPRNVDPLPVKGCNIELTEITVLEEKISEWYSVGFESFGTVGCIETILVDVLKIFFKKYGNVPGDPLNLERSSNYPSWLCSISQ
jgi:hypothetical protein